MDVQSLLRNPINNIVDKLSGEIKQIASVAFPKNRTTKKDKSKYL